MSFYLRNFSGFLIQLFFSLILIFLPFRMNSYRIGHKKVMLGFTLIALAEALLFPFVISEPIVSLFPSFMAAADGYMLFAALLLVIPYCMIIKRNWLDKAVVVCYAIFYAALQFLIINLTRSFAEKDDIYPPKVLAAYIITTMVLFPVFAVILSRFIGPYLARIDTKNTKAELRIVLITVACYAMQMVFIYTFPDPESELFYAFVSLSFIFFSIVFCIFFGLLFRESMRRTKDEEQKRLYEIQKVRYQNIQYDIENAKRIRHDQRHHMRVIADLLEQDKTADARKYLDRLMNEVHSLETVRFCTNEALNSVLQYYIGWAKENGIACETAVNCDVLSVADSDLTVLLGNTLENAINACEAAGTEKLLKVNIGVVNNTLAIVVENSCCKVQYSDKYRSPDGFLPAEAFQSLHGGGYGLKSIEATVKKYAGEATFRYDEASNSFTTRLLLNQ